jgi:hypothetical protein
MVDFVSNRGRPTDMTQPRDSLQPNDPDDSALALAIDRCNWYAKASNQTTRASVGSQVGLLLLGGATTAAAGVGAPALVTVCLAAGSFVLTGARGAFNWNRLMIARTVALRELQAAIALYQLTPEQQRTADVRRALVHRVNQIVADEQDTWASFHRQRDTPSLP